MNLCKFVNQIKVTGQKQENGAQIKPTSQSRSIYISLYLLLQHVCFFARNDKWLPTQLLILRQLHFTNKPLIWLVNAVYKPLKKFIIPDPH